MSKETMITYVSESPEVVLANIENRNALTAPLLEEFKNGNYENIWIVASGSSYNGSYCARPFIRRYLKTEVKIVTPFTFACWEHDFTEKDFVFVVSQSGYSTNSIEALDRIRQQGRRSIGITGNGNSDFKDHADVIVDYGVGVETVGYVTKGVISFALFLMLFALEAALDRKVLCQDSYETLIGQLMETPSIHRKVQSETTAFLKTHYKAFTSMANAYVCGCGAGYGIALEGALKIGETVMIPSFAYESEEFLHGPNLQLTPNYTVFLIDGGENGGRIQTIFKACKAITDRTFLITNQKGVEDPNVLFVPFQLPEVLTPLCFLPFFQILAYEVTTDLTRWKKHPLLDGFKQIAACKTENYVDQDED